jgi:hypothetical protein
MIVNELTSEHISNLITVKHLVRFSELEEPSEAVTTGQLSAITRVKSSPYVELIVGGRVLSTHHSSEMRVHSTHVGMLAPELLDTLNSTKEN